MNGAEELTAFIKSPEHFVRGKDLPASLPVRRTSDQLKIMFPIQVELRGYCPVTLKEGKPGLVIL